MTTRYECIACETPLDWFTTCSTEVFDWISKGTPTDAPEGDTQDSRLSRYLIARELYIKASGCKDLSLLRHPPHVVVNYTFDPRDYAERFETLFIFKEDNNGQTYVVWEYPA